MSKEIHDTNNRKSRHRGTSAMDPRSHPRNLKISKDMLASTE
jgi:hypothetical protein